MAYQFFKSDMYGGPHAIFSLKEFLKAQGWTVPMSSDGLTFDVSGTDKIAGYGTGAGGINNDNAWFVLRMPGQTRSLMFQRWAGQNYGYNWHIVYSLAGFSSAAANATTPPTASDAVLLQTNDGSTYSNAQFIPYPWTANYGVARIIIVAQDVASYGFCFAIYSRTLWSNDTRYFGNISMGGLCLDPLEAGSYEPTGQFDPYVIHRTHSEPRAFLRDEGFNNYSVAYGTSNPIGSFVNPVTGANIKGVYMLAHSVAAAMGNRPNSVLAGDIGRNIHNGKDYALPLYYVYPNAFSAQYSHIVGTSSLLRFCAPLRNTSTLLTTDSGDSRIVVGHCSLPWNGTLPDQGS